MTPDQVEEIKANPYKEDFPLLSANTDLAFLDSAATAQRPACVLESQRSFYETMNANALRGLYRLSVEATEAINEARASVASFIGATQSQDVVFCRNTSEALNIVAKSFGPSVLEPGDEVCISIMEHHSNLIPWQQVCRATGATLVYLRPDDQGVITPQEMDRKINERTKIVSVTHVSNVLGIENPVAELGKRVHAVGGYLVVDGAQSVPHIPVDIKQIDCDFFAFSGHKVFGPFGIGVLWGKNVATVYIRPQRHTKEFVDAGDTFTISFFGGGHMKELGYLGKVSGKDVPDKIEQSGLHLTEVDGQPGFEEATQVLVCKKLYHDEIKPENFYEPEEDERWYPEKDYHTMYIAEIRECWVRE